MKISTITKIMVFSFLFCFVTLNAKSEEFSKSYNKNNKPKLAATDGFSYYLTFHPCYMIATDTANSVSIYVVSYVKGNVTLEIPVLEISRKQELMPNSVFEFKLTPQEAFAYLRLPTDTVPYENIYAGRAIHIMSDVEVFCYGVVKFKGRSEGYNALQETGLGTNYQVATTYSTDQPAYISVIGYYDNTKVTFRMGGCENCYIIKNTGDTLKYGGVLRRTVNEGDVWLIPSFGAYNDLSGSVITSTKPCAVITGNYSDKPSKNSTNPNYLIEQELPANIWGTKYYVSPIISRKNSTIIKIFAEKPYTQVYADGVPMWTITSPGGTQSVGYIEARASNSSIPLPVTIRSDPGFPINVVQFNPGKEDDNAAVMNIPFKMQLVPIEQFTKDIYFATPGIIGDTTFSNNYINIVYKGIKDSGIPDDMQFAEVVNQEFNWIPLNAYSNDLGTVFPYDTPDENRRKYYSKTMKLYKNGVYRLKSNDLFSVTMYGEGKNGAYGFPLINIYSDLETPDTLAPYIEFEECVCCGMVTGKVVDEPRIDPENRSNLALVYMDVSNSFNYSFEVEPFIVGQDASTNWSLIIHDETKNASAHLVFIDRAGNRKDTVINYFSHTTNILEPKADFGTFISVNPPKTINKTFTLKNLSGNDLDTDKFRIYVVLDSKMNDPKPNDINTYQNFDLVAVEGKNFAPLKANQEIKFYVKFTGDKFGSFRDSIGVLVISQETGDTCAAVYFTELTASIGQTYVIADDNTFDNQIVDTRSNTFTLKISNPKTSEYNSELPISISGYTVEGDKVGAVGSGQIFEVDGLGGISDTNPLIIESGKDHQFKVSFRPDSARHFESKIKFIVKAVNGTELVNLPDNVTILNGTGDSLTSVNDNYIDYNFVRISPNPASDYIEISTINPTLKRGFDEGLDIRIFNTLGEIVLSVEQTSPSVQRIDISKLSPGIYCIKIGNRVVKFVKI